MNRTQLFAAGAGVLAGLAAVKAFSGKRINTLPYGYGMKVKKTVTINCPPEQLYEFWRNLENIPKLVGNELLSVETVDRNRSHWILRAPAGMMLEWDAEITIDRDGGMIGWRSLEDADIDNAGYVRFERALGGRSTVVRVALQYNPPAGKVGSALSTFFGEDPEGVIERALQNLKGMMETGVRSALEEKILPHSTQPVDAASEDSFPASDPPAWTGTTGIG